MSKFPQKSPNEPKWYYAVAAGRQLGIFESWEECKEQVDGFPGQDYKKFKYWQEADEWLREKGLSPSKEKKKEKNDDDGDKNKKDDDDKKEEDPYWKRWIM
jgi:ribonuclease HI